MLLRASTLAGLADGSITLAYRRQRRATVRTGGTLTTPIGVLAIDQVRGITDDEVTHDDARQAGHASRADLLAELPPPEDGRTLVPDRAAPRRPRPEDRLAPFKADVRKLKALGLTESLPVGYHLSPRGRALLAHERSRR